MGKKEKEKKSNNAGKGDKPRKVDGNKYRDNYSRIFIKDNKQK